MTAKPSLLADAETLVFENEELRESLASLELALEDRGWVSLAAAASQQFTREGLRKAAALCQILAVSNPLIKRGLSLRHSYVWGLGVEITAVDPDIAELINTFNTSAEASLTGSQAREELERALGTDGNVFLTLFTNPLTGVVKPRSIPFNEISEVICNPDDRDEPWYYLREWDAQTVSPTGRRETARRKVAYPALGYRPLVRPKRLDGTEIAWDAPVIHISVNRLDGWDFGIGDAYAAITWARAYKEFLTDWARLTKALSRFAWKISGDKKDRTAAAAARIRAALPQPGEDAAGATFASTGTNLEAIPRSGATIDSESGKPLAGMVAAAFGVPLTMLLADPGSTGARAVAETLDEPMRLMAQSRRDLWTSALKRIYDYVIDQAVIAPRGPLAGVRTRDGDNEIITLAGGDDAVDRLVTVEWPSLEKIDAKTVVDAIVAADGTEKIPPLTIARLLLVALGVEDIDLVLDELTDDDGFWIDPHENAGQAAVDAFRRGEDPAGAL